VEFTETTSHGGLRADAARLNAAVYMLELVAEMLPQADPHPEVFDLLHNALARLGQTDAPAPAVLAYFQWRLLKRVGLLGELRACVACGRQVVGAGGTVRQAYFSSQQGGLLCGGCENTAAEKFRVSGETLAGLAALAAAEAGTRVNLPERQARAVNRMLAYHVREQLGKELKTAPAAIA
jgi:DNA repair protein RecO